MIADHQLDDRRPHGAGDVVAGSGNAHREAAARVGLTVSSTIVGMALGAWMGGVLFDLTGSYRAAFINGIAWNVLNAAIAWWLLSRQMRQPAAA